MVLNLKDIKKKTFELTLIDGTTLSIKKPNEDILEAMEEFELGLQNVSKVKDVFCRIKDLTLTIMNRNTQGKIIDKSFFDQRDEDGELIYDYSVCMAIFTEYSKFSREVLTNPN